MSTHALRLTPGTDLKEALERLNRACGFRAAYILTCVGSLTHARLRMPAPIGAAPSFRTWAEPMEIVSLTGTLSPDGVHIHISLARADGGCVGGHLAQGCIVNTTAELVIGEASEVDFHRAPDPATGYAELSVSPRASEG
jgi:predicted DNA-binding protein with PD1-like motif